MKICHIFISGFVQGVGFRRFVKHHAVKLGLTGWVKNLPDNRVEAAFQGSKEQIEKIISICQKGAFLSEVKDVVVEWEESSKEAFNSFEILS
ncbi:MAG: acylphosphatase [bacterium]|nr:acylphosphatase [bacterium]